MAGTIAKQGTPTAPPVGKEPTGKAPTGPTKPGKLLIFGAALLTMIAVQIAVTELLLSPGRTESDARGKPNNAEETATDTGHSRHDSPGHDLSEVSLGGFSFSNRIAVAGIVLHVDFDLAAVALQNQAATLESQAQRHRGRIREAINAIVRNSNYEELNDPNLATVKRLIHEEINRLLEEDLVIEVVINDVRVLEQ